MSTIQALEPLSADLLPFLRGIASELQDHLGDVRTAVTWSSSEDFPLTLFLTATPQQPYEAEGLVFEMTFRQKGNRLVVSTELLSEEGDVVAPTVISNLSLDELNTNRSEVIRRLRRDIAKYVEGYSDVVQEQLAGRRSPATMGAAFKLSDSFAFSVDSRKLVEEVRREFSAEFSRDQIELPTGRSLEFDYVSSDKRIVGELKRYKSAAGSLNSLTSAVWKLQQLSDVDRRFIVLMPVAEKGRRWVSRFGSDALGDVELWGFDAGGSFIRVA